jgi:hypothetical protein
MATLQLPHASPPGRRAGDTVFQRAVVFAAASRALAVLRRRRMPLASSGGVLERRSCDLKRLASDHIYTHVPILHDTCQSNLLTLTGA